jgi:hypothetical protein
MEDEKQKADKYYAQEHTERDLIRALKATRMQFEGIPIIDIAKIIKNVLAPEEVKSLMREIKTKYEKS